ncbi:hypothetical protein [Hymenobacter norwichensis]|uniref:hypothetical protein n=1 Tax=Hymenobacter norwichensis TaxID=223903 RepID=UPI0003B6DC7C|nr:hypothetical protein [Hymenobacter norwichensis]
MPCQLTLSDKYAAIVTEALEFYGRFLWGQTDRLPASLDSSQRMLNVDVEQIEETLLPFRKLVWPELHGWGHSLGVGYIDGHLERQAA